LEFFDEYIVIESNRAPCYSREPDSDLLTGHDHSWRVGIAAESTLNSKRFIGI
jgi:hypothetical protein